MARTTIIVAVLSALGGIAAVSIGGLLQHYIATEERAWREQVVRQEREWSRESIAAAFAGAVVGIILEQRMKVRWPKSLLVELKKEETKDKWEPTGIPPEKDFVIFNALASKIGRLGPCLSDRPFAES